MKQIDNNIFKSVTLKVPSRLNLDVLDIQKMSSGQVAGGGIGIAISVSTYIKISIIDNEDDIIEAEKKKLIMHILDFMRKKLNVNYKFNVVCNLNSEIKQHGGMGSNATIQTGIIYGINELMGRPLSVEQIEAIIRQKYCEEVDNEIVKEVYCTGVAYNTIIHGGLCFIDENGKKFFKKALPNNYMVGIAKGEFKNFYELDGEENDDFIVKLRKENDVNKYYNKKKFIIRKKIISSLEQNNFYTLSEGMKEFALNDDSRVLSKEFTINGVNFDKLYEKLDNIENTILRISSNSPYLYVISPKIDDVKKICNNYNIKLNVYEVDNDGITVIERV